MEKKFDKVNVYAAIQDAFKNFYDMARIGLKKRWKDLTAKERADAGRALVFLNDVIAHPAKYFSRANTGAAWIKRANDFAEKHGITPANIYQAYYIVPSPKNIVCDKVSGAWAQNADMGKMFYRFCTMVQDWEYKRTSESRAETHSADAVAKDIMHAAKRYAALRKNMEPSKVQAWLHKNMRCLVK